MKIGDFVSVIDHDINGKIKSIKNDDVIIIDQYGFSHQFSKRDLIIRDKGFYEGHFFPERKFDLTSIKKNKSSHHKNHLVLDLHFEKLVNHPHQYDSFERFFIQKEKLINTLEFCKKNRIKKLEIIHGIGDGVLQKMVYETLRNQIEIDFDDHDFFYHQSGSVIVLFKN